MVLRSRLMYNICTKKPSTTTFGPPLPLSQAVFQTLQLARELPALGTRFPVTVVACSTGGPIALENVAIGACRVDDFIPAKLTLIFIASAGRGNASLLDVFLVISLNFIRPRWNDETDVPQNPCPQLCLQRRSPGQVQKRSRQ
jgi:hypothetical protein